jgi:hypothetical protein
MVQEFKVKERADFLTKNVGSVKHLIESKGFSLDIEDYNEKVALLHTEVSELIDAYKKGKGDDAEGEEIADILIRLMNIPCILPKVLDHINTRLRNGAIYFDVHEDDEKDIPRIRYELFKSMHKSVAEIGCALDDYMDMLEDEEDMDAEDNNEIYGILHGVGYNSVELIMLCEVYAENILNKNLQDLVDAKMAKNWERPYRYNTNPELFDK